MEQQLDNYEVALANAAIGIVSIPCHPGTKVPMVKWKRWQTEMPPAELLRFWFEDTRTNIAILTTGMVLFDVDDPDIADLVLAECGDTPHRVGTPGGGIHLAYAKPHGEHVANQVKIKGLPIDIRTDGGAAMIPPSRTEHGIYAWLGPGLRPVSELPVARIDWTRERTKKVISTPVASGDDTDFLLYRGRKYVDTFKRAVSGQRGHDTLFGAANKIARFVAYDWGKAWQLLLYYNATRCDPPWDVTRPQDERALRHKLEDAFKKRK